MTEHGLGAIQSPPDERDFPIDQLYAITGTEKAIVIPEAFVVSPLPAILNQGTTPQCVAYSSGAMKLYEDGPWPLDENTFFVSIGGGPGGAVTRYAFKRLLSDGYPPDPANHKIGAYYAVTLTRAEIQAAIMAFGPLVIGMSWLNSMFRPAAGVLTCDPRSGVAGGHAILLVGWKVINGAFYWILQNSWGINWGVRGQGYLSGPDFASLVGEAWKAVDVLPIPTPPTPTPEVQMIPTKSFGSLDVNPALNVRGVDLNTGVLVDGVAGKPFAVLFETTLVTPISPDPDSVHVYAVAIGTQLVGILARNCIFMPAVAPAPATVHNLVLTDNGKAVATATV